MLSGKHGYKTLDKYVYYEIIEKIKSGKLKPDEHLTESRISKELNVSRSPIRRAFSSLVAQGILEHRTYSGVVVKDTLIDSTRYIQLLDVIKLFIRAALDKDTHSEKRICTEKLDKCIQIMEEASYLQNLTEYNFNKNRFFLTLVEHSDNPYYVEMTKKVIFKIDHLTDADINQLTEEMREQLIERLKSVVVRLKKAEHIAAYREIEQLFDELVVYAFH